MRRRERHVPGSDDGARHPDAMARRFGPMGIAVGTVGALAAARFLESILYGISPSDGLTYAAVAGSLALVTVIAAALPARRALAVNPVTVLRQE